MTLEYVEMSRLSQFDTNNAAIRFIKLGLLPSKVENCAIHDAEGIGIYVLVSSQVVFNKNIIYRTRRNAIIVRSTSDLEICDNLIIGNQERVWNAGVQFNDYQVAFDVCVGELLSTCSNMRIQRNTVAGAMGTAFTAPAADCTDENTEAATMDTFKDNVAHSTGVGLISLMNHYIARPYCGLVHDFTVHHAQDLGVLNRFNFADIQSRNIIAVDCGYGVELGFTNGDNPFGTITFKDSLVVGEHAATVNCNHPNEAVNSKKVGMVTGSAFAQDSHVPYMVPKQIHVQGGAAAMGKAMYIENVVFANFNTRVCAGALPPEVINLHSSSGDLIMHHVFRSITLIDVLESNFLFLASPVPESASITECGQFVCTGRLNVLFQFTGPVTQVPADSVPLPSGAFTIISNNPDVIDESCELHAKWNVYVCTETNWGLLQFESMDSDSLDRSVQPVFVTSDDYPDFKNKLNSFADHASESIYEGQKRMSRFVSLMRTDEDGFFEIAYTGTPPLDQSF